MHGCRWTQAASGAAGRVNVGLAPRLVYQVFLHRYLRYVSDNI